MIALMLVLSRFQIKWQYHRYEVSRWLIFCAMMLLAIHFVLQISLGIRAKSDELGVLVNILFYMPIAIIISYATYNVICFREGRRRYLVMGIGSYALVLTTFVIGFLVNHSLHIGIFLYAMFVFFICCIIYCILMTAREIRHHRKIIEEESATDLLPYDQYTWACYVLVAVSVILFISGLFHKPLLFVLAPLMLLSLFVFVTSFIGYGFNIVPVDISMHKDYEGNGWGKPVDNEQNSKTGNKFKGLSTERIAFIGERLQAWCDAGGFRDSTVNLSSLSSRIGISRGDLSLYFDSYHNCTFRVWLSDIRFQEAQRMRKEKPQYNNDAISSECGFSAQAHV